MGKSTLKRALLAEKGKDPREKKHKRELKQKQKAKLEKKNRGIQPVDDDREEDSEDDEDFESGGAALGKDESDAEMDDKEDEEGSEGYSDANGKLLDIEALRDTDSESESDIEMEKKIIRPKNDPPKRKTAAFAVKEDEDEDEEDIPLSDVEGDEDREDMIPHTKLTINNKPALLASLDRIRIDTSASAPFASHQTFFSSKPTADAIPHVSDDLQRELALLAQSLEAARKSRALLVKEGVPFTRPGDYFAEMAKDDGQMQKVKAKLVEEATAKKAAAEARKLRDLKKFGKQVQVAKLQERQKEKRETLDKIKALKKKRQEGGTSNLGTTEGDLFDVAVDEEIKGYGSKGKNPRSGSGIGASNAKRQKKNERYGFGGKKKHSKSGDAVSSGDVSGFNNRRGGPVGNGVVKGRVGKPQRPGKSRRKAMASR